MPLTRFYYKHSYLNNFTIAFDSFLIDMTMFFFMFRMIVFGKSSVLIVYLFFFYPFRFLSLYGGHWPLPDYQTFHYPGIPSVLVPYDQTNDFYFSGHTGLCTVLMFMFILHYDDDEDYSPPARPPVSVEVISNQSSQEEFIPQAEAVSEETPREMTLGHKLSIAYGVFLLSLTLYMLTITRGHYFNDLLIGFIVALTGIYYARKLRFMITYYVLVVYAMVFNLLVCSKYRLKKPFEKGLIAKDTDSMEFEKSDHV